MKGGVTMEERIKSLREELHLTQKEFGEKIGITNTAVSKLEKKERAASDRVVRDICREFNVNEEWLRTGQGEMFVLDTDTDFLYGKALKRNNNFQMRLLNAILQLDDDELEVIEKLVEKLQKNKTP